MPPRAPAGERGRAAVLDTSRGRGDELAVVRRRQIMNAAFDVMSREGVGEARLIDIAEAAGLSLGSLQHYFRHRDVLVTETFRSLIELSGAIWRHVSRAEPDPLRRVLALLRLQVKGWAPFDQRWAFWLEFWSAARRLEQLKGYVPEIYARWQRPFEEALTEGAAAGILTMREPVSEYSLKLMAMIDGFAVRVLVDPKTVDEDRMAELLVSTICRDLSIADGDLSAASVGLPHVIGISYPAETPLTGTIDWSPLDRPASQPGRPRG